MAISNMKCVMSNGTYKLLEFGTTTKLHRCFLTKNPFLKPFLRISMVEPNIDYAENGLHCKHFF